MHSARSRLGTAARTSPRDMISAPSCGLGLSLSQDVRQEREAPQAADGGVEWAEGPRMLRTRVATGTKRGLRAEARAMPRWQSNLSASSASPVSRWREAFIEAWEASGRSGGYQSCTDDASSRVQMDFKREMSI